MKEIRNEFEQSLVDNGYTVFTHNHKDAIKGFQKKVVDEEGVRYFITIYHYNHREQLQRDDIPKGDSYSSCTQFTFGDNVSDISFFGRELSVESIEDFFYKCWTSLQPDYYS